VALARAIRSSVSLKEIAEITGPKISSCAIRILSLTLANTVGARNSPSTARLRSAARRRPAPWRLPSGRSRDSRRPAPSAAPTPAVRSGCSDRGRCRPAASCRTRDAADELVIDLVLDEQPRAGAARSPGIGEHRHRRTRHRRIEVGVGEHDVGRFAAEFERDALEVAGGRLDDRLPGHMRAGEGDLVDAGMRGQCRARGLAVTGTTLTTPGGCRLPCRVRPAAATSAAILPPASGSRCSRSQSPGRSSRRWR